MYVDVEGWGYNIFRVIFLICTYDGFTMEDKDIKNVLKKPLVHIPSTWWFPLV